MKVKYKCTEIKKKNTKQTIFFTILIYFYQKNCKIYLIAKYSKIAKTFYTEVIWNWFSIWSKLEPSFLLHAFLKIKQVTDEANEFR